MIITITDDFNLQKIADSGQCFRVKKFDDGTFRFITDNHILYITEISPNSYKISCSEEEWLSIWYTYFDFNRNYSQIRSCIPSSDQYMQRAAIEGTGIRILRQSPWEMLITFIISQRKSIPAIKKAVECLAVKFGTMIQTPYEQIWTFPTAVQLAQACDQDLIDCKLGYRVSYVKDAISKVLSGQIDLSVLSTYNDTSLFNALKEIHGVGDKVSNCICLFAYGRSSAAPVDTWILKIINQEYNGQNPFPSYGETAGIMQQYCFYYAQTHKKEL